jgi:hypothetical protein
MATALQQQVDPSFLLSPARWSVDGWNLLDHRILKPVLVDAQGNLDPHVSIDGFEWEDVSLVGIGSLDNAMGQLRAAIQQRGSDLYSYAILSQDRFNVLGITVTSYRLVIVHSQVQVGAWAVAILFAAFAAIIFIQYLTTGHVPSLRDLQDLFGGAVSSVAQGAGQVGQAIVTPYVVAALAAGVIALAFSYTAKQAGVKAPTVKAAPSATFGGRAGPFSGRVST